MLIFDGQNINPNSNPIVANNAELYTLEFDDDDGFFGLDDQDDTVTIINVTDPNNPVVVYSDASFVFVGTGVFPPNAQPPELQGREIAVIDVLDANGNVIDSFFLFIDGGQTPPIANGNSRLTRNDLDPTPTPICFVDGVLIETPDGPRAVETLRVGDLVQTSNGLEAVVFHARSAVSGLDQIMSPKMRRVLIKASALGRGVPDRDLRLSQQHRICFEGPLVELFFGVARVFAPAKALVDGDAIVIEMTAEAFDYHHLGFARHTAVNAHGAALETLYVGDGAEEMMDARDLAAYRQVLGEQGVSLPFEAAGRLLTVAEARMLAQEVRRLDPADQADLVSWREMA